MSTLDLGWKNGGLGKKLSNLFPYPFVLDGVKCGSLEGFLQGLKQEGLEEQEMIAVLSGFEAYKVGQLGNDWKEKQLLYWRGKPFERFSRQYHRLLDRAYDSCFDQNEEFRKALFETGVDRLTHHIGHHDPSQTTLTEWEYTYSMYRLRARAQQEML
jgi:hypothetical protein